MRVVPALEAGLRSPLLEVEGFPRWKIIPLIELDPPSTFPRA